MVTTLFTNLSSIDGTGSAITLVEMLVERSTIVAVARGASQIGRERAAEVINGRGALMPGLAARRIPAIIKRGALYNRGADSLTASQRFAASKS